MQKYGQNLFLDECDLLFEEYLQDKTYFYILRYILKRRRKIGQSLEERLRGGSYDVKNYADLGGCYLPRPYG